MGIKLIVEIMDLIADRLTATEWKAMVILAEDANDAKRLTWSSVNDKKITDRIGLSTEAWTNLRGVLVRKGVLEVAVPGKRGQVAKYRFPQYRPMGHETHEETPMGHEIDDLTAPKGHETDEESAERVMGSMTPTPPCSSPTSSSEPADPSAQPATKGGGGGQRQDEHPDRPGQPIDSAETFLQSLPGPWAAGRKTARELAPLLLERIAEQGWDLDDALAVELTKNPNGISSYRAVLPGRIDDLAKKPSTRTRDSPPVRPMPPWCQHEDCDEETRYRYTTVMDLPASGPCYCHPDHYQSGAA